MRVIGGSAGGRRLKTRKGSETRPTADRVKEALFNMLVDKVEGCMFLDIYAGNGGIGIEALSRGAKKCVFIEKNIYCVRIIKENLLMLGFSNNAEVIKGDAIDEVKRLSSKKEAFDLIFLDPPYFSTHLPKVLAELTKGKLLAPGGLAVVEHQSGDFTWFENTWHIKRTKTYGETALSLLMPATENNIKMED